MKRTILLLFVAMCTVEVSAQQRSPFSDRIVNHGDPDQNIWTQFMPYAKGTVTEELETSSESEQSSLLPAEYYRKMLDNLNRITGLLRSVTYIGQPQGVDIRIYKTIGHNYNVDQYDDYKEDPEAQPYGEICVLVDPCIFYQGKRGNAEEMFARLTIRINNIQIAAPIAEQYGKPAQAIVAPKKVSTFYDYDIYQLDGKEYAIITHKKVPPFIPISQERYLKASIERYSHSKENGMEIVIGLLETKLAQLSDTQKEQQAVVNMEYEEFSEAAAAEQAKYFIANPQLTDRSQCNDMQLITISWSDPSPDTPLRLYRGGNEGFNIRYALLKQLYEDRGFWHNVANQLTR